MHQHPDCPSYKPSAGYFRRAIRAAKSKQEAQEIGICAVNELERLKAWVREIGLVPPKWKVLRAEARDKGWLDKAG